MKLSLPYLLALLLYCCSSCSSPIEEFEIYKDSHQSTLKLYADSTFVEEVNTEQGHHSYKGTWSGSLEEGDTFVTKTNNRDLQSITLTFDNQYTIQEGKAVLLDIYLPEKTLEEGAFSF